MTLSAQACTLIDTLNQSGYEAYAVGGAVRDMLRGKAPDDIDITTNASPEQMVDVFSSFRTIPTGLRHGTLTVLIDRTPFEVTTYRTDGTYSDGRHPDTVCFTSSLTEDLARRDFTVNAIAYHPSEGIIDPFGGQDDLNAGRLRCVGEATERFSEDALRIARLLRFMSVLDFTAEEATLRAAKELCERLTLVAAERKRVELTKALVGTGFEAAAVALPEVMGQLVPALRPCIGFEQYNPHHKFDVYKHTIRAVQNASNDLIVRLAVLLHDVGKPSCFKRDENGIGHFYGHPAVSRAIAERQLKELRFDNATTQAVLPLIKAHDIELPADRKILKRRLQLLGKDGFERLLAVKEADASACRPNSVPPDFGEVRRLYKEILDAAECFSLRDLAMNGNDLIVLGYPKGPLIGTILSAMLDAVVADALPNTADALTAYAKECWPL